MCQDEGKTHDPLLRIENFLMDERNVTCDNLTSYWSARWLLSPSQRSPVGNVKDLMRVQKFPEAVEKLSAFQTAALRVDEDQQRTDVFVQLVELRDDDSHH